MLGIIMLLSMVFDISANLSEFMQNNAPISAIFFEYYLNFLVYYGNTFSSIIVFISVIWFTAKMTQDSEIIPMLFSGRPFIRILKPYAISATILLVLSIFINHFLLPISNKIRLDFEEKYYRSRMLVENYHAEFNKEKYVYFSSYNNDDNIVYNFNMEQWSKSNAPLYFIRATMAKNYPGTFRWELTNYYERRIGDTEDKLDVGQKKDTVFTFKIEDLAYRDNRSEIMKNSDLKVFIAREEAKGSPNVALHKIVLYQRTAMPFAVYVLTLIGVAVSSTKKRGGIGLNIAIGLGFVFIYIFSMKIASVAAINVGFPPLLAVWIPNILFTLVGVYLYKISPK
jgi:lipopolysaccharide export system permease protein